MDKKPEVVATLSPAELQRFNAWRKEQDVIQESSREAMRALMFSIKADHRKSLEASKEMWKDFETAHGLDSSLYYGVNTETGDIVTHEHSGIAVILGSGHANESSGGETQH